MDLALLVGWLNLALIAVVFALHVRHYGDKQAAASVYLVGLFILSVLYKTLFYTHAFYYIKFYFGILLALGAAWQIIYSHMGIVPANVWVALSFSSALFFHLLNRPTDIVGELVIFRFMEITGFLGLIFIYRKIVCPIVTGFVFYGIAIALSDVAKVFKDYDWQVLRWVDPPIFTIMMLIMAGGYVFWKWNPKSGSTKANVVG